MKKTAIVFFSLLAAAAVVTTAFVAVNHKRQSDLPTSLVEQENKSDTAEKGSSSNESNDPFEEILNADLGLKVKTGVSYSTVGGTVSDNWYKLDEDDDNVYLIYGDYYRNKYISDALLDKYKKSWDSGIVKTGTYDITPSGGDILMDFLTNGDNWVVIRLAFEKVYPYRTITAVGSPTKEQIEAAAEKVGGLGYDHNPNTIPGMFRPHPGAQSYEGCYGYWLATRAMSGFYMVRCNQGGIRDDMLSNGNAVRPVVCISKAEREKTAEEESRDQAKNTVEKEAGEVNEMLNRGTFQLGEFSLHYGKYVSDDKNSSYTLNENGSLIYESASGVHYTGKWEARESEYDGWALFLTDETGEEKMYWSGGNDWFDTAFMATMTYRYSSEDIQKSESGLSDTFRVGGFTLHFGRYVSEDGTKTYILRSDGTYTREYEQTVGDTGNWKLGTNDSGEPRIIFDEEESSIFGEFVVTADDTFCYSYKFSTTYTYVGE